MNIFKKITLILTITSIGFPAFGMEGDNGNQGFFGSLWNAAKEHPVIAGAASLCVVGGLLAYKNNRDRAARGIALHDAIKQGDIVAVKDLLAQGVNIEVLVAGDGNTPLREAIWHGHTEIVKLLLAHGANIEAMEGDSLRCAAYRGHVEILQILLANGAHIEARTWCGDTVLHAAAERGCTEIVKLLLAYGANIEPVGWRGCTPMHYAAEGGRTEIVKLLLAHGANIESVNKDQKNPLHFAAKKGHTEIVKLLLAHGANIESVNKYGQKNPLYLAAKKGRTETVQCMLQCATFSKPLPQNAKAKMLETLRVLKLNNVPRDIRIKILVNVPENTLNVKHFRALLNGGAKLNELVVQCPFELVKAMYDSISDEDKGNFLDVAVPAIVNYRMGKLQQLLDEPQIQELHHADIDPVILTMLDCATVEQHRAAIEQNVLRALIMEVSHKEIQHVIPAIIALTKKQNNLHKDVGGIIAAQLIPAIVSKKLVLARKFFSNISEEELRQEIIQNINMAIARSPRMQPSPQ